MIGLFPSSRPERGTLLDTLDPADATALASTGTSRIFQPGETLINEGMSGTEVFVLLDGVVKVLSDTEDGRIVMLAIRVAGDIVGELAVLDDAPRVATVRAAGQVRARVINAKKFLAMMDERPTLASAVHKGVSRKFRMATHHRIDLGGGLIVAKVARVLNRLATEFPRADPQGVLIDVRLTHEDLCGLTGASAASLERSLQQLRTHGLISTGTVPGKVLVTNEGELRKLCVSGELPS